MKRIFFMAATFIATTCFAQVKEGTIVYERKINVHRTLQDEQMKAMIPEFRTDKFMLQFSNDVSLYKTVPEDEAPDPFAGNGGGARVVMRFGGESGETFKNYTQLKVVQSQELGAKMYIIEDSIKPLKWKLTEETKTIMGHVCHKATTKQTLPVARIRTVTMDGNKSSDTTHQAPQGREVEVVAWYADDIVVPAGPGNYTNLPGAVLLVDVDNGQTVYTTNEIKTTVNKKELVEPTKGKKVTQEEFRKMQMEMMQNMNMGGGNRTMRF